MEFFKCGDKLLGKMGYNENSMKERTLDRFLRLRAEQGHIAPTYFLIGENVYEALKDELYGALAYVKSDWNEDFTEICGVPVVVDYTTKDSVGAYYRMW